MRLSAILLARKIAPLTIKHSNLPEEYIRRCTEVVEYVSPKLPNYRHIILKKYKEDYQLYRPWSKQFQETNYPLFKKCSKIWVEPVKDWSFFRGDRVEILSGKDKGKQGLISYIIQERNWVLVQGLNLVFSDKQLTYRRWQEAPLLINREVSLVDPVDLKPTKVEWRYDEDGKRVRVSVRSGRIIPIPVLEEQTYDYKTKNSYLERSKDTKDSELSKVTFVPKLKTFEMDIMDEYNITEDRIPAKTYWY